MASIAAQSRAQVRTLDNSPSFKLDRGHVDRSDSLQLLSNLSPGQRPTRNIVVATSLAPEAATALAWAVQHLCRSHDAVHLVHVVRCLSTPTEVYHMGPGNAFSIDERPHHERQEVLKTQAIIKERLLPLLGPGLFYDVRIFVDTWNAPPDAVGSTVLRVAAELNAFAIVVAGNDQSGWDPMRLGSITKWLLRQPQPIPIALVRKLPAAAARAAEAWLSAAAAAHDEPAAAASGSAAVTAADQAVPVAESAAG